ncbi:MAG: hypothetical protein K9M57_09385 [Phycisphaerae bacterium]|nr:hypothetical protein [Phycisphaerae bacterium]
MSRSSRPSLLTLLLTFFAGAISMFLFLTPGKVHYRDILDPGKRQEMADFTNAAKQVERVGDMATYYAYRAKHYIKDEPENQ